MDREQIKSTFDRQASTYDQQWSKLSAPRDCPHLLLGTIFGTLPANARILCVGAGTGAEMQHVAVRPPDEAEAVTQAGGFEAPVQFYQAGLIHAWFTRRLPLLPDRRRWQPWCCSTIEAHTSHRRRELSILRLHMHCLRLGEEIVNCLRTVAVALMLLLTTSTARADPVVFSPYESLPWLKLGSTRQSDVVRVIGQPTAVIDEARFRSEITDRRSEYKALGITVWYLLDGEPDPMINQVVVEPPFQGQSSLGLRLGTGREQLLSKLAALYKPEGTNQPEYLELTPLTPGHPKIDLWFANGNLSGVRLTHFLPPSARAEQDEARVAELIRRDNLQDGFAEVPRCDYKFRINRRLDLLKQKRVAPADSNINWRLELFENGQSGTWTLVGYSKDNLSSSTKACELASGDAQGTQGGSYRTTAWYRKYFR